MNVRWLITRYLLISLSVFLTDVATKWLVVHSMYLHDSIDIIPHFFSFTHVHNPGVAFGMLRNPWGGKILLLSTVAVLAVCLILYYGSKVPAQNKVLHWALALVLGGILGNLSDRLFNGYVIDFLDFHLGAWHWPAFNVADAAICVGVGLMLIDGLLGRREAAN